MDTATIRQVIRYVIVGGAINASVYVSFVIFRTLAPEIDPSLELLICSVGAMPLAYFLNRIWVFTSSANSTSERNRFVVVYVSGAISGLLISKVFWVLLPFDIRVTQAIAMIVIAIASFLLQKFWTFHSLTNDLGSGDSNERE